MYKYCNGDIVYYGNHYYVVVWSGVLDMDRFGFNPNTPVNPDNIVLFPLDNGSINCIPIHCSSNSPILKLIQKASHVSVETQKYHVGDKFRCILNDIVFKITDVALNRDGKWMYTVIRRDVEPFYVKISNTLNTHYIDTYCVPYVVPALIEKTIAEIERDLGMTVGSLRVKGVK